MVRKEIFRLPIADLTGSADHVLATLEELRDVLQESTTYIFEAVLSAEGIIVFYEVAYEN